jgi:hypothetical protein
MDVFVDLHQYGRIAQAQNDADRARNKAEQFALRLDELERRNDRIALACQALWEILRERTGLQDEDVFAKMAEIDLRDGKADGRVGAQVMTCTHCRRPVNSARPVCIYCGHHQPTQHIVA